MTILPIDLSQPTDHVALEAQAGYRSLTRNDQVRTFDVGDVDFPTGRVVAADPFCVEVDDRPLDQEIPTGTHTAYVAQTFDAVVGLLLVTKSASITSWEAGTWGTPARIEDIPGYPVDAGTGAYLDASNLVRLVAGREGTGDQHGASSGSFYDTLMYAGTDTLDIPGGGQLVMTASGYGDGSYSVWVGRDEVGDVCVLATEFVRVGSDEWEEDWDDEED